MVRSSIGLKAVFAGAVFFGAASGADASIVLFDNFDSSVAKLNWSGDAVFKPVPAVPKKGLPSVDLVGASNGFGGLAFSGNSVDLDGTTGIGHSPAGELKSTQVLSTGSYTVTFEFAGNLRNSPVEDTIVSIGSAFYTLTPSSPNMPYKLVTLYFNNVSGALDFLETGPSDLKGNLIDNVTVYSGVPEVSTWVMLLIGLGGLGFMGVRPRPSSRVPSVA